MEKNTILLELIHGGIYNGQRVPTHRDGQYFIAFVDDFSKYCYTYFTSFRSGLFDKFKTYKAKVENRLEKKIKILWFDRGGEYAPPIQMGDFCQEHGIIHEVTSSYAPQSMISITFSWIN